MSEENTSPGPYGLLHLGRGSFGEAIKALKDGKMVQRMGWNGKGLFIFMQVPSEISKDIVPKMQSLPQSVKDEFQRRFDSLYEDGKTPADDNPLLTIKYHNQLAMVYPDNNIYGWVASPSDVLEQDWNLVE